MPRYDIYGFVLETDQPVASSLIRTDAPPDVVFSRGVRPEHTQRDFECVYDSSLPGLGDEALFSLYRSEHLFKLRYSGTADFYIDAHTIQCRLLDPKYAYWIEIALLGPVMSFWLELRGLIALHAAAVVHEGRAIGMMASSTSGKTSLAASMMQNGSALLTDDIMPVSLTDKTVTAHPGYPQMRMWPDQAAQFVSDPTSFPLAHPDFDKRRLPAGEIGGFHSDPAPLETILLPTRTDLDETRLERVPRPEAVFALLRGSFAASILESMPDFQARRLKQVSHIVSCVPVYRFSYPQGYDRLPDVVDDLLTLLIRQ